MKKLLLFFILSACTTPSINTNISDDDFDFKKDTSFIDFKNKLNEYNKNNPYPKIDSKL
tara:strand:- start:178 stop:354 length:177 start_codon:yes stop_codon:yes gene_type:complete